MAGMAAHLRGYITGYAEFRDLCEGHVLTTHNAPLPFLFVR
jgi:hypothetical protein